MIHLDTHVVVWLYKGDVAQFPESVLRCLERRPLQISPMVELELEYLYQIGRVSVAGLEVVEHLARRLGLRHSQAEFSEIVRHAAGLKWTRDPFDRLIVGTAIADGATLLTRDTTILSNFSMSRWEQAAAK